jgi:hypothetical protein
VRGPERARGLRGLSTPDAHSQAPELHPLEVLEGADPYAPDDDLLRTALELAVVRTVDTESPDVGAEVARRIADLDSEYGEAVELEYVDHLAGLTPWDPMLDRWGARAWDILAEWLRTARRRQDAAALAEHVLRWVEERLGRSGPGLEQQAILLGGPGARRPLDLEQCLRDDLVAVQIWLVAGIVAVTGSGGPAALVQPGRGGHTVTGAPTRRRGAMSSGDPDTARVSAETVGPER